MDISSKTKQIFDIRIIKQGLRGLLFVMYKNDLFFNKYDRKTHLIAAFTLVKHSSIIC